MFISTIGIYIIFSKHEIFWLSRCLCNLNNIKEFVCEILQKMVFFPKKQVSLFEKIYINYKYYQINEVFLFIGNYLIINYIIHNFHCLTHS